MKILIIGSEGFIGSHLLKFLKVTNEVYSCDFLDIRGRKNYFQINPTDQNYLEIFNLNGFDVVINCAGSANVSASLHNPTFDYDANVNVVAKLLSGILQSKKNIKLVNISSAAVYGNPTSMPIKIEHAESSIPISPYGVHKRITEVLLENYSKSFNIPSCSLRLFSAYGNGQRKLLLWDLYKKFSEKDTIELFGTGNESRDYIHIEDICQQVALVIENGDFKGEAYNIANGTEVFIKDLADLFLSSFQNRKFEFTGTVREGDPLNWKADIQIMKDWGYEQKISLESGVSSYIQWAQKYA